MSKYNIIFSGEISDDFQLKQVQIRFKKYFHLNETQIKYIFYGNDVILKKNITQQQALALAMKIDELGGVCYIEASHELPFGISNERREHPRRYFGNRRNTYRAGLRTDRRFSHERRY